MKVSLKRFSDCMVILGSYLVVMQSVPVHHINSTASQGHILTKFQSHHQDFLKHMQKNTPGCRTRPGLSRRPGQMRPTLSGCFHPRRIRLIPGKILPLGGFSTLLNSDSFFYFPGLVSPALFLIRPSLRPKVLITSAGPACKPCVGTPTDPGNAFKRGASLERIRQTCVDFLWVFFIDAAP